MTGTELLEIFFKTMRHFYPKFIQWLGEIPDPRNPNMITYKSELLLLAGVFLFLFKLESRRNINFKLAEQEFVSSLLRWLKMEGVSHEEIIRIAHGDTVEYFIRRLEPKYLLRLPAMMVSRLIRMRALEKFRLFDKYYRIAIDGTWELNFGNKPHCDECLKKKVGKDKDGNPIFVYYHPVVEAKLVTANGFAFSIATEFIKNTDLKKNKSYEKQKQDCELKAFYRLAQKIKASFPQLPICLSLDALYAGEPIFDICEEFSWKYIITFKEGSMSSVYQEFEALKKAAPENSAHREKGNIIQDYSWVNGIDYNKHKLNALEFKETSRGGEKYFVWLTNFTIGASKNYEEIMKGGRCHWKIENQGFNIQKNGGYGLEHAYSQNNIAIEIYYILLQIAHNINQLMEKGSLLKDKLLKVFGSIKNFSAALLRAFTSEVFHFDPAILNCRIQIRFAYDSS